MSNKSTDIETCLAHYEIIVIRQIFKDQFQLKLVFFRYLLKANICNTVIILKQPATTHQMSSVSTTYDISPTMRAF